MADHWKEMEKGSMTKIKICGLKRPEDVELVNEFLPDYVGFVFARSPRQIGGEQAMYFRKMLDSRIQTVGVFVNADLEEIEALCSAGAINLVQLHGDETVEYMDKLYEKISNPIIKAVRVRSQKQILEAEKLPCSYLLLDTYCKGVYGGSGTGFDKSLVPVLEKPYFLAGGLSAENVCENIRICHPYAVDVSSAVETDGVKDREKIKKFIERVRNNE